MQRIFLALFTLFIGFALPMQDAEAKRFGGGKSSGVQRDSYSKRSDAPSQNNATGQNAASGAAAAAGKRSWLGPIAGLAAGLGLAALASHLGLGEEFANMLMIALLVMAAIFLFKWFTRKRQQPAAQPMQYAPQGGFLRGAGMGGGNAPVNFPGSGSAPVSVPALGGAAAMSANQAASFPPGFDAEAFRRQAKLNFIRLQAAYDAADLDDIRDFTTPEMFAEIKLQIGERGASQQRTEVDQLDAEVLECVEEADRLLVSVRFHGLIREDEGAAAAPFDEVWHLSKPAKGNRGWAVAGIQQAE